MTLAESVRVTDICLRIFEASALAESYQVTVTWFRISPDAMFWGFDNVGAADTAARATRYYRLLSREVEMQAGWELHNPTDNGGLNPYEASADPSEPLTDVAVTSRVLAQYQAWLTAGAHPETLGRMVPALHVAPADARGLLKLVRDAPEAFKEFQQWSQVSTRMPVVRARLKHLRALAGEHGPDDGRLLGIFGGGAADYALPAAPPQRPRAAPHTPPGHASVGAGVAPAGAASPITPGRVVAAVALGAVALGAVVYLATPSRKGR